MTVLVILGLILVVMLFGINGTEDIGTGQTYTTIQGWENALPASPAEPYTGRCLPEAFAENVLINGQSPTAVNYIELMAKSGAEHDGRAHEVSAAGNARIEYSGAHFCLQIADDYVRVDWLEIYGPGDNNYATLTAGYLGVATHHCHHNIIHNNDASAGTAQNGIEASDADATLYVYRNVVYGTGMRGILANAGAGNSAVLCNTVYQCNNSENEYGAGIRCNDDAYLIEQNACFDNSNSDIFDTMGVMDYNATSDGTGDDEGANGIADLVTADQFVNPTTTWGNTDLLPKAGADILGVGDTFSTATYPEIDVSIDNRGVSITGAWDIGAGQYVGGAPPVTVARGKVYRNLAHGSILVGGALR